jgi:hypothetical protein
MQYANMFAIVSYFYLDLMYVETLYEAHIYNCSVIVC